MEVVAGRSELRERSPYSNTCHLVKSHTLEKLGDAPKQVKESKRFHDHSNKRPLEEYKQDASQKTYRPTYFLFASEKIEGLLRSNYQGET